MVAGSEAEGRFGRAIASTNRGQWTFPLAWLRRPRLMVGSLTGTSERFLASLCQVAGAVAAQHSAHEVLTTVVDEAKTISGTDKAVLCLFNVETDGPAIDASSIVVRGSRSQHPEVWWRRQLESMAAEGLMSNQPTLTLHERDGAWLLCVPIRLSDDPIGVLAAINASSRSFTHEQVSLLVVLGTFAGVAIQNARLVEASRNSLLAGERERISKEMHDGLAQTLFSVSLNLGVCKRKVASSPDEAVEQLAETQQMVLDSLGELRRYIYDLRPVSLERLGLPGAIESHMREMLSGRGLIGQVAVYGQQRPLRPAAEACAFRVAQESIANVVKHARARNLTVSLRYGAQDIELAVEDDGDGFDVDAATRRSENGDSIGLRSIRERVFAESGLVEIASESGRGSRVNVWLPC